MQLPDNILSSLVQIPHNERLAQAYLQPVDLAPGEVPPWARTASESAIAFQYWPESIQDSRSSEWSPRNIPGGSHPIYQWTHGGERRLSFTVVFTTDTAPGEGILGDAQVGELAGTTRDPYAVMADRPLSGIERGTRDVDIRAAVSWLRWFTYPAYDLGSNPKAYEPAKALLVLPGSGIGHDSKDSILCVMTQCDVTYEAFFPDGFPRIVEVQLEFAEVVQMTGRVRFQDRRNMILSSNIKSYFSVRNSQGMGRGSGSSTGITR